MCQSSADMFISQYLNSVADTQKFTVFELLRLFRRFLAIVEAQKHNFDRPDDHCMAHTVLDLPTLHFGDTCRSPSSLLLLLTAEDEGDPRLLPLLLRFGREALLVTRSVTSSSS